MMICLFSFVAIIIQIPLSYGMERECPDTEQTSLQPKNEPPIFSVINLTGDEVSCYGGCVEFLSVIPEGFYKIKTNLDKGQYRRIDLNFPKEELVHVYKTNFPSYKNPKALAYLHLPYFQRDVPNSVGILQEPDSDEVNRKIGIYKFTNTELHYQNRIYLLYSKDIPHENDSILKGIHCHICNEIPKINLVSSDETTLRILPEKACEKIKSYMVFLSTMDGK